jgi:hypothetical protein
MKIFISWSGARSKNVAKILADWLQDVIQGIEPFVSEDSIDKGSFWQTTVLDELREAKFGIICVTPENTQAPWLNFEAGALIRSMPKANVGIFLLGVRPSDLTGSPLAMFQGTSFSKEDIKQLVRELYKNFVIAGGTPFGDSRLENAFNTHFNSLESQLSTIVSSELPENQTTLLDDTDILEDKCVVDGVNVLEDILEVSRNTQLLVIDRDQQIINRLECLEKETNDLGHKIARSVFNNQDDLSIPDRIVTSASWDFNEAISKSKSIDIACNTGASVIEANKNALKLAYASGAYIRVLINDYRQDFFNNLPHRPDLSTSHQRDYVKKTLRILRDIQTPKPAYGSCPRGSILLRRAPTFITCQMVIIENQLISLIPYIPFLSLQYSIRVNFNNELPRGKTTGYLKGRVRFNLKES